MVTNEQRSAASTVFMNFKKTKSPFQLCKHILGTNWEWIQLYCTVLYCRLLFNPSYLAAETSQVDYMLFEAAGLIKDGLIREWSQLSQADITALRSYLLQYVIGRHTLSPFVRERIVMVMAIIIKRQSVEDFGEDRRVVLEEVKQLIANGNMQTQMIGCSILAAMMQVRWIGACL